VALNSFFKVTQIAALWPLRVWQLQLVFALLLTFFYNQTIFNSLSKLDNRSLSIAIGGLLFCINWFICQLTGRGKALRTWLTLLLIISATCQYFMLNYGVLIDNSMLLNTLETDLHEVQGLLSLKMLPYLLCYLLLPVATLWQIPLRQQYKHAVWRHTVLTLLTTMALILLMLATQYQSYASVFRQHRYLKHQALPLSALTATAGLIRLKPVLAQNFTLYATDATQQLPTGSKPRLIIMVLGETVRADHLGINGYTRNTTPKLAQRELLNLGAISACGTTTAVSVPCLFSYLLQDNYNENVAKHSDNFLDVLQRAGVKVLWRNNNSGCKTMCDRVEQDKQFALNSNFHCVEGNCSDLALLSGLKQRIIELTNKKDAKPQSMLIVLHQQGNHGPEYYKRSLAQQKVFLPECESNLLNECTSKTITNAYDNAIVATDALLDETINLLETFNDDFDTAMVYLSDHGESLGENGIYLHGLPYWMAPSAQTQVPLFFWMSASFSQKIAINKKCIASKKQLSHDNIFDTMLSLFSVRTLQYRPALDLLAGCAV